MESGQQEMKIKRFFATDMRGAIRQVRDEQGADAVILSTRSVEGGIEIISAIDFDETLVTKMAEGPGLAPVRNEATPGGFALAGQGDHIVAADAPQAGESSGDMQARAHVEREAPAGREQVVWTQDPAITEMQRELKNMKALLQDQLSQLAWNDFSRREPLRARLLTRLGKLGLEPELAREIAHAVNQFDDTDRAWQEAQERLVRRLRVGTDELLAHGGIIALVGATGVGKTTTVAKIAARYALRHGPSQVALVTTDAYRVGAQKQLLAYGRLLDVPVHVVSDSDELNATLARLRDRGLVLIDTAGMSQRDLRLSEQFTRLACLGGVQSYLVASANTQRPVLDDIVRTFGAARLAGCIVTKTDEAVSLGDVLSVMIRHELPIAYVADGQQVPEDLHVMPAHDLVGSAVALARRYADAGYEQLLATADGSGGWHHA